MKWRSFREKASPVPFHSVLRPKKARLLSAHAHAHARAYTHTHALSLTSQAFFAFFLKLFLSRAHSRTGSCTSLSLSLSLSLISRSGLPSLAPSHSEPNPVTHFSLFLFIQAHAVSHTSFHLTALVAFLSPSSSLSLSLSLSLSHSVVDLFTNLPTLSALSLSELHLAHATKR